MINKRIMLAEDDSNLGSLLRNYLAVKNYDTTLFMNGRSAIEAFSAGLFDLCILDIMMPEMDGLALAKALRDIDPAIPIIFLTAKNQEEDIIEGFKTGAKKRQLLNFRDQQINLTTKESELLGLLCRHKNEILERNYALKNIWIDDNYFNARSMDVYITRLRKYLKKDPSVEILNIHGKGYRLIC
jgi:two-component system OmpR family response regulator